MQFAADNDEYAKFIEAKGGHRIISRLLVANNGCTPSSVSLDAALTRSQLLTRSCAPRVPCSGSSQVHPLAAQMVLSDVPLRQALGVYCNGYSRRHRGQRRLRSAGDRVRRSAWRKQLQQLQQHRRDRLDCHRGGRPRSLAWMGTCLREPSPPPGTSGREHSQNTLAAQRSATSV
eukprot:scaffold1026_cov409-Prasinococcus_capsulatus_cf.AAC.23